MFQKKPKYELTEDDHMGFTVRITKGQYKGTEYKYLIVTPKEDKDNDQFHLQFTYEVLNGDVEAGDEKFIKLMGDILVDIIDGNTNK